MKNTLFLIIVALFSIGCQCKKQFGSFNPEKPIEYRKSISWLDVNHKRKMILGTIFPSLKDFKRIRKLRLKDGGMLIYRRSYPLKVPIIVGKGDEFRIAGNKYRVLDITPKPYYRTGAREPTNVGEAVILQLIKVPAVCSCQNKQLREFNENANIDSLVLDLKRL